MTCPKVKVAGVEAAGHARSCSSPVCRLRPLIYSRPVYEQILWVHDCEMRKDSQSWGVSKILSSLLLPERMNQQPPKHKVKLLMMMTY